MSRGRILLADNNDDFREVRAQFLRPHYDVLEAATVAEAERILRDGWIHLAIVDIRLNDDFDDRDESGLRLAQHEHYRAVPKIVLTAYPTYQYVRTAFRPHADGSTPTVDFLEKTEGAAAMVQAVERAFASHVRINWDLVISWQPGAASQSLVNDIDPALDRAVLPDRILELEDLLRKLFFEQMQISVRRLPGRRSGPVLLLVFAYGAGGIERQFVVSCGRREQIASENERYARVVPHGSGSGSTHQEKTAGTSHFAATAYTLVGADLEATTTLREAYQTRSAAALEQALAALFEGTLAHWHRQGRALQPATAARAFYHGWLQHTGAALPPDEFKRRVATICRATLSAHPEVLEADDQVLTLHLADGSTATYPHPALALYDEPGVGDAPVPWGIIHGQVDPETVLVDEHSQTWLIDFTSSGEGPLIHDFVTLEMAFRLDLLSGAGLSVRQQVERRLLDTLDLSDPLLLADLAPDVAKAVQGIAQIRQLSGRLGRQDARLYLQGLLFAAARRIAAFDPELRYPRRDLMPFAHSVLLAAMLAEQLVSAAQRQITIPSQARHSLWIDEPNKAVWVEGRLIGVSPQEFKILSYLYQHVGTICSREDILRGALAENNEVLLEESRLNSAMSRLRKRIELDAEHPKYLVTVRGYGFKLEL